MRKRTASEDFQLGYQAGLVAKQARERTEAQIALDRANAELALLRVRLDQAEGRAAKAEKALAKAGKGHKVPAAGQG